MTNSQRVPLEPLPSWEGSSLLSPHIGATDYLLRPEETWASAEAVLSYTTNEAVWRDIANDRVTAGMEMVLECFELMNWFPRAPGLYFTPDAELAREEAYQHLHHGFRDSPIRDHAQSGENRPALDYTVVFTPAGKMSMLRGGIGAIRLKPISIDGKPHWLMTATSDGVAHTGIPLAVPLSHYRRVWNALAENGAITATIHGRLDFLPDPFSRLFANTRMMPKLYLRVLDLQTTNRRATSLESSVAVSFVSDFEGSPQIYVSYVTFRPDVTESFDEAVTWLKQEYVEGEYGGRIITDFDQTRTIFQEAELALSRVMDRHISAGALQETIELMNTSTNQVEEYFNELDRRELLPRKTPAHRNKVFISYAHAAETQTGWVKRIRIHLRGLVHESDIEVWHDSRIEPGQRWQEEVETAINQSRVAILVLTADFLASDFIRSTELPLLLEAADSDGAKILIIYGSDVHLSGATKELSRYQYVNKPDVPLQGLTESERESVFKKLAKAVEKAVLLENS